MTPHNILPIQWTEAQGVARQACARIFRDGGEPGDALNLFAISRLNDASLDWSQAVDLIAQSLCVTPRKAAA